MIEHFSREQFEEALPKGFWQYAGLDKGEHTYNISITDNILIHIRSSVDSSGFSADKGEDSIRAWLITSGGQPLSMKTQKYITRVKGWENRLLESLRKLWFFAQQAGYCEKCGSPKSIFKTKADKKLFCKCIKCDQGFKWLTE